MEGRLIFPRLGLRSDLSFLVDTGADQTMIHPLDGTRMGIDYPALTDVAESIGVGGISRNFIEPAVAVFAEPRRNLYVYNIQVAVCPPSPDIMDLPSLLGRDILDNWRMTYSPQQRRLVFKVLVADATIDLSA